MNADTNYLDALDRLHEKTAHLYALLALMVSTDSKCLVEGVRHLTRENIFYLAGSLADDIGEAVTAIYQCQSTVGFPADVIEALCFKSNHLGALFDVLNNHLHSVDAMSDKVQQNLVWLADSLVDDILQLAASERTASLKAA